MFVRVTSLSVALLGALSFSVAARAADIPAYAPMPPAPVATASSWTGLYLGFGVGGALSSDEYDFDTLDGDASIDAASDGGWLVDGTLGYDYRMGAFVVGAFADLSWTGAGSDAGVSFGDGITGTDADAYLDSEWGYDVVVRAGVLLNENALLYALGGYSWRKFEAGYDYAAYDDPAPDVSDSDSSNENSHGWTFGGGIEAMVTSNLSVKGEYRYTGFDDITLDMPDGTDVTIDPSEHSARIGVNYRFGNLF